MRFIAKSYEAFVKKMVFTVTLYSDAFEILKYFK